MEFLSQGLVLSAGRVITKNCGLTPLRQAAYPSGEQTETGWLWAVPGKAYAMVEFITDDQKRMAPEGAQTLDALTLEGARRMIDEALELEVEEYFQRARYLRDEGGHMPWWCATAKRGSGG